MTHLETTVIRVHTTVRSHLYPADALAERLAMGAGYGTPPDKPGSRIELDEDVLKRHAVHDRENRT